MGSARAGRQRAFAAVGGNFEDKTKRRKAMKTFKAVGMAAAALAIAGCASVKPTAAGVQAPEKPGIEWAESVMEARDFEGMKYRIYVPEGIGFFRKAPLVVFFHGAGERGTNNRAQLVHGVPQIVAHAIREGERAIVVAPQCPAGAQWVDTPWGAVEHPTNAEPSANMGKALALLDKIMAEYPVDRDRVYVTGISMGGYGTWDAAVRRTELFAAAVPVCGGGDAAMGAKLKGMPIHVCHGDADGAVPVENSRKMVKAIRDAGGDKVRYNEIKGAGHNVWTPTYNDKEVLDWMFAQER